MRRWSYLSAPGLVLAFGSTLCFARQTAPNVVAIQFQSPVPDARYILPTTTIVIRTSEPFSSSTESGSNLFKVVGSSSGFHTGAIVFSDDRLEVIFKPDARFAYEETVSVDFAGGLTTTADHTVAGESFRFYTGKQIPADNGFTAESMMEESEMPHQVSRVAGTVLRSNPQTEGIQSGALPLDFPHVSISSVGTTAPGYLFLASNNSASTGSYLMIVDIAGNPIFYRKTDSWCLDFKIQPTGQLTYLDITQDKFYVMDATYAIVDSITCGNGYTTDWRDLRMLPNGHSLLMGDDREVVDMSKVVPGGDSSAIVIGNIIQELDSQKNVVFEWRSWDHFQITDATHEDLTASQIDYVHANSLELDSDGNIILSSRHMDEITKIDRGTGQILWRWGGKNNQFTMTNDSLSFSHQHAVRLIGYGDFVLFDNGNYHTPSFSRAVEYSVDESRKKATLVWQYRNSPDIYGNAMGYVQRLPGGNTLIGWGIASITTEIAPNGSKVFQLSFDPGIYSYRAYRYDWHLDTEVALRTIPTSTFLSQNYPNPFNGETTFQINLANPATVSFKVYDILGREVMSILDGAKRDAGLYSETLNLSAFPSGVYFCRLTADSYAEMKKLVMIK